MTRSSTMRHVCSKQPVQLRESGKANGYRAQRASKEARATTTRHDKRFRAELGKQTWNNDALDHLFRAISLDLFPAHEHGFLGLVCHQGGKGQCCFQNKRTDRQRQRETERDRDRDRDRDRESVCVLLCVCVCGREAHVRPHHPLYTQSGGVELPTLSGITRHFRAFC